MKKFLTQKSPISTHKNHTGSPVNVLIGKHHMPAKSVYSIRFSAKSPPRSMHFCLHSRRIKIPLPQNSVSAVREQRRTAAWTPSLVVYHLPLIPLLFTNPNRTSPRGLDSECGVDGKVPSRSSEYFARTM